VEKSFPPLLFYSLNMMNSGHLLNLQEYVKYKQVVKRIHVSLSQGDFIT